MNALVIIGAGGFGREVLDVVEAINAAGGSWRILGAVDDAPTNVNLERLARRSIPYLGGLEVLLASAERPLYSIGIGAPGVRRKIAQRMDASGFAAATLVHPHATVGSDVQIESGTVICAGGRIGTNTRLGGHVHVNPSATVGHDTTIGRYVSLNPCSNISGDCVVEDEVLIGASSVVLNQLRVGARAVVGGAACVVRDVPADAVVKGVPAR